MQQVKLQYVQNAQIDKHKWDRCIRSGLHPTIYAYSVYLDAMADHWDALVLGDYEVVMPLTWRKKYGTRYLYQPAFIQQLGLFSASPISEELLQQFIQTARRLFNFCEIFLNEGNKVTKELDTNIALSERTNYVLMLDRPHEEIATNYKDTLLQDIGKAVRSSLRYINDIGEEIIIDEYRSYLSGKIAHIHQSDYDSFKRLCKQLKRSGACITRGVKNDQGELLAQALLLKDDKRIYNILSVIIPKGRELKANHFLYDSILKEFQHSGLIFDFEGSELPGVKQFYKSFGSINRPYYFLKYNDLSWWKKIFKK